MTFHVKRRRWVDTETGKSVSKRWDIVAEGARFSKEFAAFFKRYAWTDTRLRAVLATAVPDFVTSPTRLKNWITAALAAKKYNRPQWRLEACLRSF